MSELPLHRHYLHYSELPYSQRVLYTSALLILGMGYLFAMLNLYFTYAGKAGGNPLLLTPQDLIVAYSGSGQASRLESALRGPMSTMLPREEVTVVVGWIQAGDKRPDYEKNIRPILDKRCMACHDGSNPHLPNLNGYDNLKKVTEQDRGATIPTLVRVSHIHLFGLTFIFFLVGLMFSHAYVRPVWFKCVDRRAALRGHRGGRELLVHHQDLPSFRLRGNRGRRSDGGLLRPDVGGDDISNVVVQGALGRDRTPKRRPAGDWARAGALSA